MELLAELNRVQKRWDRWPIVAIVGALITLPIASANAGFWWLGIALVAAATAYVRNLDVIKGTAILTYSLDEEADRQFSQLQSSFDRLSQCHGVWHVSAQGHTGDWKRNSGVNTLANRSSIRPSLAMPPKVQCNIKVPTLKAAQTTLYFFPDRLLVYNSGGVGAVSYEHLQAKAGQVRFVEGDSVPRDASQVGATWQYVNKSGGPDKRFKNNRQLPIMLYGELLLTSPSGVKELFEVSIPAAATAFASALSSLGTKQLSTSSGQL